MNIFASPRTTALAVSTALFVLQLVAFGSSADPSMAVGNCPEGAAPSAITVPPVAPHSPSFLPVNNEASPVSI